MKQLVNSPELKGTFSYQHKYFDKNLKVLAPLFLFCFFWHPVSSRPWFCMADDEFIGPCSLLTARTLTFSSSLCWPVCSDSVKCCSYQLLLREASVDNDIKVNAKCNSLFPALLKTSNPGFPALLKTSNPEDKNIKQDDCFEIQTHRAAVGSVSSHTLCFLNASWILK